MIRRFLNKAIWLFVNKIPWKPILIWGPWVVILLVASFYGIENWRGNKALIEVQKEASAEGISLNYRDYIPQRSQVDPDISSLPGFDSRKIKSVISLARTGRSELAPSYFLSNLYRWNARPFDIRTALSSPPASTQEAATELSRILAPEITLLDELKEELKGKMLVYEYPSRFSVADFFNNYALEGISIANFAGDDCALALALGDGERAFDDIMLLITFAEAKSYPNFIELLIKNAFWRVAEQCIWEAVLAKQLDKEQLKILENKLESNDGFRNLQEATKGEMAFSFATTKEFELDRDAAIENYGFFYTPKGPPWKRALRDWTMPLRFRCAPKGWFRHDAANGIKYYLPLVSDELQSWAEYRLCLDLASRETVRSYLFNMPKEFADMIPNVLEKQPVTTIRIELARIGIALEIYKLDFGSYPERLTQLGISIPEDPFREGKIQYRLQQDGTPLVWSVGLNRVDEGGLPQINDPNEGDIVWHLSPIPGLTEADLRKKLAKHRLD